MLNNDELLDIVDENDLVIDKKNRTLIHNEGLLHREIHVWFFDKSFSIVFQKRGIKKTSAGLLDSTVGGHVDTGESYVEAALREIKEEIGIKANKEDLFFLNKFRFNFKNFDLKNNVFREVFIFKKSIDLSSLVKEKDVIGVDFVSLPVSNLDNLNLDFINHFDTYILTDEIPEVIKYIKSIHLPL